MDIDEILQELNDGQKEAAKHIDGPALVVATAGAGKTKTLIARTQYMIMQGIDPSKILLTTFTNKAASEIKKRIVRSVGEVGEFITVGTIHSVCNRILRIHAKHIDYNNHFTIIDEADAKKLMKKIAKKYELKSDDLKQTISSYKSKGITYKDALKNATNDFERNIADCYSIYQEELKRSMSMDFDDLLLNTYILLENNPEVLEKVNKKWQYISADENQDSSDLDSKIFDLLGGKKKNIFFVGDDYQSIYGFRNANIEVILNLKKRYPNLKHYNLGVNYRSTKTIVDAGASIIKHNKNQLEKEVSCGRVDSEGNPIKGSKIIQTKCKNQKDEAEKIVIYARQLHKKGVPLSEIAVLYRASYLSRTIEEAFIKNKISYNIVGGTPFFRRAEIQDILAYIKLVVNESDFQAFKRTIGIPKRGIGEKTIEKIDEFIRDYPLGNMSIRKALNDKNLKLKGKNATALQEYNNLLKEFDRNKMLLSTKDFVVSILESIDYIKYLEENYKDDFEERIENVYELLEVCTECNDVEELLIQASLYEERDDKSTVDKPESIQLMTVHKSKGLEFDAVIMSNMVEGIFPHYLCVDTLKDLEEERRLAFVGITRAKNFLFMTYPQRVKQQGSTVYAATSRFLDEIDPSLIYRN